MAGAESSPSGLWKSNTNYLLKQFPTTSHNHILPDPSIHILMTGAGAPGAAGIIRCLQQSSDIQLTVADADKNAVGRYLTNDFVQVPKGDDASFIDTVFKTCTEKRINLILPLVTKELA